MSSWFESVTEKLIHCRVEGLFQKRFRRSSQTTTEREQHGTPLKNQQGWKSVGCVGLILIIIWHRFVSMMEVWIIYIYINLGQQLACDVSWCLLFHFFISTSLQHRPHNPWTNGTSSSRWSDGELFNNSWEESITPAGPVLEVPFK